MTPDNLPLESKKWPAIDLARADQILDVSVVQGLVPVQRLVKAQEPQPAAEEETTGKQGVATPDAVEPIAADTTAE